MSSTPTTPTKRLSDLFFQFGSDKNTEHSYGPFYDDLLERVYDRITAVLEVGIQWGCSLRAWRAYFPSHVTVVGIDNHANPGDIDGVIQYNRTDSTEEDHVFNALGDATFDFIVDDGSHWEHDQIKTWEILFPRLRPGGFYVIEDIQSIASKETFERLGGEFHDRRPIKQRPDDMLVLFSKPL